MKILLSPAKSIDFNIDVNNPIKSTPLLLNDAEYLVNKLKKLSAKQISKLMKVSDAIGELNHERFNNWKLPFTDQNSKAAADIFTGAAYQGLDYPTLNENERVEGQDRLRILSGLYGVLKPLDLIQPYRLEMGTSYKVTPKITNLYKYWDNKIFDVLNQELANDDNPFVVNVASSEYFKAAKLNQLDYPVITPVFKDKAKSGDYKVIMTFAKKARGLMTRYIIQNKIDKIKDLKGFDYEGYKFMANESSDSELVFYRG